MFIEGRNKFLFFRKEANSRLNTPRCFILGRSLLNIQAFMCSNLQKNLLTVDLEALQKEATNLNTINFISMLPIHNRKNPTIQVARIIIDNIKYKKNAILCKSKPTLKMFVALKIAYFCCFRVRGKSRFSPKAILKY